MTSANLTRGRVVKDRSTKKWRLNLRNWECGVLVAAQKVDSQQDIKDRALTQDKASWKTFMHVLPIPIVTEVDVDASALLYNDERPWFFMGGA